MEAEGLETDLRALTKRVCVRSACVQEPLGTASLSFPVALRHPL